MPTRRLLRALSLLCLALLLAVAGGAQARPPRPPSPETSPDYRPLLRGGTAIVYRHREKPVVAKLIAKQALPPEQWISYPAWLAERHGKLSARDRALVARETLRAYLTLKQDPALRDLLPRTWSPAPGRVDQRWATGRDWDHLSPAARQTAMAEMVVVIGRAQKLLPGMLVDEGVYNFKFDRAGHVKAWFDWVLVDPPAEAARGRLPEGSQRLSTLQHLAAGAPAQPRPGRPASVGPRVLSFGANPARALQLVTKHRLQPRHSLALPGAKYSFSDLFSLGDGRVGALGVVEAQGTRTLALFWRSTSQGLFRLLPALNGSTGPTGDAWFDAMPRFDKGVDENALNLPPAAQSLLARLTADAGAVRRDLSPRVVQSLLASVVPVYRTLDEYRAYERSDAHPRYHVRTLRICTAAGRLHARSQPDFTAPLGQESAVNPLGGRVQVLRCASRDRRLEYRVHLDEQGKAWIADVTLRTAPLNRFGLPLVMVDAGAALAPRWEYTQQIPAGLAGARHPRHPEYSSNWNQLRQRPELQDFYAKTGRPLPAAE